MHVDVPSPVVAAPPLGSSSAEKNNLLEEKHLKFRNTTEKDTYTKLKTRRFILTPTYDPALLQSTGVNTEFEIIFETFGWENVWEINGPGLKLLTAECLYTLQTTDSEVIFRLFGKDFSVPKKNFSELLGFHA